MSYRTFVDSSGKRWEVWLVTPAAAERRKADRRTPGKRAVDVPGFTDRRRTPERRKNPFHRTSEVASEYSSGWLCFEGDGNARFGAGSGLAEEEGELPHGCEAL